jgi:tannase/feruloyl esterase
MTLLRFSFPICLVAACAAQTPCNRLVDLAIPKATITAAESVPPGPLRSGGVNQAAATVLPAHCRVSAVLKPTSDSHIEMEVWMPAANWNGKFQAVGNGGWAGSISRPALAAALLEGYATASTDTGHKSSETPGGSFAPGHPEKLTDYGYRAVHEMTVHAKTVIRGFYGRAARFSYWNSCSNGGRQALMEAQRYPQDFDGIVAGAPAANWTGRAVAALWVAQAVHKDEASYLAPAKYPLIHSAVLQACDALDGVRDGILEDPMSCRFDPEVLRCKQADGAECLTGPQVETVRKIYAATEFYPGLAPGSELGWATYGGPRPFTTGADHFKFIVFPDTDWDFRKLNMAEEATRAAKMDNGTTNALDPNLRAFFAHGGKLIQYHGWSDPQIPPLHSVNYYRSVLEALGGAAKVQASYRLFMAPGMAHCGGGPGPNQFNALAALERWRESGVAPDQITAAHVSNNRVDLTRPLCPYPQVAQYKGAGSTSDAANFVCKQPTR